MLEHPFNINFLRLERQKIVSHSRQSKLAIELYDKSSLVRFVNLVIQGSNRLILQNFAIKISRVGNKDTTRGNSP